MSSSPTAHSAVSYFHSVQHKTGGLCPPIHHGVVSMRYILILLIAIAVLQSLPNGLFIFSIILLIVLFLGWLFIQVLSDISETPYMQKVRELDEFEKNKKAQAEKLIFQVSETIEEKPLWLFSKLTNIPVKKLSTLSPKYKKVSIPKKTGGTRQLQIPYENLKRTQKAFANFITKTFESNVHPACHSYREHKGILTNSIPHLNCAVLIKLDIKDYFQNITLEQVTKSLDMGLDAISFHPDFDFIKKYAKENHSALTGYLETDEAQAVLKKLVYSENGLPQGAPTSPVISNLVLSDFDKEVYALVTSLNGAYTRYSDDITISFKEDSSQKIAQVIKFVEAKLAENGFKLNKKKGKINVLRPHQAQRICGVTINSGKPTISRKQRRLIRAAEHNAKQGKSTTFTEDQIKGHQSFQAYVKEHGEFLAQGERIEYLKTKAISARGRKLNKDFIVLKGSKFDISKYDEAKDEFQTLFSQLKQEGVLVMMENNIARFKKNHQFRSKTLATSILHMRNVSPTGKWV